VTVTLLIEFAILFLIILVLGYVVPAWRYYWWYYVRTTPEKEKQRIQQRRPTREQIWREVRMSVVTVVIFALMATALLELYKAGWTRVYLRFRDYPLWYFPVSVFLCLVFHDTYFYWTHRFMHWRPVFKYFHQGHHQSVAPTPWAIFAFQPLEAATQFAGIMMMVMFIPLHPLALLLFFWHDGEVNTAGHTGYELVPKWLSRHWLWKGFNTVRHHDAHHTNTRVNFGSFFNVWDRWMGTFHDAQAPEVTDAATDETREFHDAHDPVGTPLTPSPSGQPIPTRVG
jgi:sterol desaturase/sphingolipid hydroxylase (fatty acid hydroxylase superfamily)